MCLCTVSLLPFDAVPPFMQLLRSGRLHSHRPHNASSSGFQAQRVSLAPYAEYDSIDCWR